MISIPTCHEYLDDQLAQEGFAIMPSFISEARIALLQDFFFSTFSLSGVDVPFFTTHWSSRYDYRHMVNSFVVKSLKPDLDKYFLDYKCLFGYFLFKSASPDSAVHMHRDWTLIDEEKYTGYILWIPLVDTSETNGCFQVIPRSHLAARPRGSNLIPDYSTVRETDFEMLPIRAGDAIIFDHRLLHASPPNISASARLSVGLIIAPSDAETIHYFRDPETGETNKYDVGNDFLVKTYYDYQRKESPNYILDLIT